MYLRPVVLLCWSSVSYACSRSYHGDREKCRSDISFARKHPTLEPEPSNILKQLLLSIPQHFPQRGSPLLSTTRSHRTVFAQAVLERTRPAEAATEGGPVVLENPKWLKLIRVSHMKPRALPPRERGERERFSGLGARGERERFSGLGARGERERFSGVGARGERERFTGAGARGTRDRLPGRPGVGLGGGKRFQFGAGRRQSQGGARRDRGPKKSGDEDDYDDPMANDYDDDYSLRDEEESGGLSREEILEKKKGDKKKALAAKAKRFQDGDQGRSRRQALEERLSKRGGAWGQRFARGPKETRQDRKKKKAEKEAARLAALGIPVVRLDGPMTVGNLADQLRQPPVEVVKALMRKGMMAAVSQTIEQDVAKEIALLFEAIVKEGDDEEEEEVDDEDDDSLVARPPVVTIMGHVDHGKTTLLDALRDSTVADSEEGGITQHIGAYSITTAEGDRITFVDTPGHAAFNAMRERGADITDIVVLVIAADDGVRPQTVESIRAAKAADVPIIVAITKADKPGVNVDKVKRGLLELQLDEGQSVLLEEYGGDVLSSVVSAKTGEGLDDLLDQIVLQAEVLDLKANNDCAASGTVIEAKKTLLEGTLATVLVQRGTLRVGDVVVAGSEFGSIRALRDDEGTNLEEATPAMAVEVVGLSGLPAAGDSFTVMADKKEARKLAESRRKEFLIAEEAQFFQSSNALETKTLEFMVKADVQGSAEAVGKALQGLEAVDDKLRVNARVLKFSAGPIENEDIMLAAASSPPATLISFGAPFAKGVREFAERNLVEIQEFKIIYDVIEAVQKQLDSYVRPPPSKELGSLIGKLFVKQTFKSAEVGKVAGCQVVEGYVRVGSNIRIVRGLEVVYEGKLRSLRSVKAEVDQVDSPNECGISFKDYLGMEVDDLVEVYGATDEDEED